MRRIRVIEAAIVLAVARVTLGVAGFARVRRMLTRERGDVPRTDDAARARVLAQAMVRAAHHLPLRTTCLDRALALWWLLGVHGIGGAIRIGVRGGEKIEAHAWVEHAGEVLYDDEAKSYAAFDDPILR